jgi:uracil-DNA glycosylase family protein
MAAHACRACPIGALATQAVCGEGPLGAQHMLVGEQPGDQEDLAGRPFVGPAGQLLDRAMAQLGWARDSVYLANAVKHFKYELRGKRRIHKTAGQREAEACAHWLDSEISLVRPRALVALGATAARALLGRPVAVQAERGAWLHERADGRPVFVTLHPSALLRLPDGERAEGLRPLAGRPRGGARHAFCCEHGMNDAHSTRAEALAARPLTPQEFAPYGTVIAAPAAVFGRPINGGNAMRFDLLDDLQLGAEGGRPMLALFRAQARRFPHAVDGNGAPCPRQPDLRAAGRAPLRDRGGARWRGACVAAELAAFVTDGRQGVVLAPGTWHHALLAIDAGDFVVVERAGGEVDCGRPRPPMRSANAHQRPVRPRRPEQRQMPSGAPSRVASGSDSCGKPASPAMHSMRIARLR